MIKKFDEFNILNENVKLTDDEKNYLWSKIEYRKKQRASETENDLYKILKGDKTDLDEEEFNKVLNSLEYTFRKKLSAMDTPLKSEIFTNIVDKLPKNWLGIKYSSINAKKKRDKKNDNKI